MKRLILLSGLLLLATVLTAQLPMLTHRNSITLTEWQFAKGIHYRAETPEFDARTWEQVRVPHTWSMDAIQGNGYYRGEAWYRTNITLPESMAGQRIFLRFQSVGQEATIYVNSKFVGRHIGGYSAFCFEITDLVEAGQTALIAVKANNKLNVKRIPINDALFNAFGGIYRPVQIFSTPQNAISPLHFASPGVFVDVEELDAQKATLNVRTHISRKGKQTSKEQLHYRIFDADNQLILEQSQQTDTSKKVIAQALQLNRPVLWQGRENPYLYRLEVTYESPEGRDLVSQHIGLRKVSVSKEKGVQLNGRPYPVYGVCMHQEWENNGPALLPQQHKTDMELIHEIGATGLRLSHYQHSDLVYQLADEAGLMVWAEIPFVHNYSGREGGNAAQQLRELILQNYNHPSIFVWGIWNEVRAYDSPEEACVKITKDLVALAHELDDNRLTTSASDRGISSNMGNITDLQAWNKYFGWYKGTISDLGSWLDESQAERPDIPMAISEYGAGGNIAHQDSSLADFPFGNYFPESFQSRYHEQGWQMLKERPQLWGTFVWNMFDFSLASRNRGGKRNLNHKGLVTYNRKIKKDAFYFYKANWSKEPVLYIAERRLDKRKAGTTTIKIYTNLPEVTLQINGQRIAAKQVDGELGILYFKDVQLEEGLNLIQVFDSEKTIKDETVIRGVL